MNSSEISPVQIQNYFYSERMLAGVRRAFTKARKI